MKSVTVNKIDLIEQVTRNRTAHVATYEAAVTGWHVVVVKAMQAGLRSFQKDDKIDDMNFAYRFPKPVNHGEDYDRALAMLGWETGETVRLEEEVFANLVLDDWNWKRQWVLGTSQYVVS